MNIAAIIPVKTFSLAKTRLDIPAEQKVKLCRVMLEEVLKTVSTSPRIQKVVVVTKDSDAARISKGFGATVLGDEEKGVNQAVSLADRYVLEQGLDASIVLPQDIPYVTVQDVDFVMNHMAPPNFAIIVPSRRFDGTNALVRMPADLMGTHYDEDSYRMHMSAARKSTSNAALVFSRRIMMDVDNLEDLEYLVNNPEKPGVAARINEIIRE